MPRLFRHRPLLLTLLALVLSALLAACGGASKARRTLRENPDPEARMTALEQLDDVRVTDRNRDELLDLLAMAVVDPNPEVASKAVELVAEIGGPRAQQILMDTVRGKQYSRAALNAYQEARQSTGESPEVLLSEVEARLDLGELTGAEVALKDVDNYLGSLEDEQAAPHLMRLKQSYDRLIAALQERHRAAEARALQQRADALQAKIEELGPAAMGQFGGMGGMGGLGGGFGGGFGGLPPGALSMP